MDTLRHGMGRGPKSCPQVTQGRLIPKVVIVFYGRAHVAIHGRMSRVEERLEATARVLAEQGDDAQRLELVQAEHYAILGAIERRDSVAARQAMREHIENARKRVFEGN